MPKIFISHSSQDNAKALAVAQWLETMGWGNPFLDIAPKHGLAPGKRWREALTAAAGRCEAVICLLSQAWLNSGECRGEFAFACYLGKALIGVIVDSHVDLKDIPEELQSWQICTLVKGDKVRSFTVSHDPIVPLTHVEFSEVGLALLQQGIQNSSLNPFEFPWPPPNNPNRAPYQGLKALEGEDAAIFFGRDAELVACFDRIRGHRLTGGSALLILLGASGAGKSSFLRAGVLPRLHRNNSDFVTLPIIRPEGSVLHGEAGVAHSLGKAFAECKVTKNLAEIRAALRDHTEFIQLFSELQKAASKGLSDDSKPPTLVLPIDQGEELFTSEGRAESELLLEHLGQSLAFESRESPSPDQARPDIIVIIAIRSDSYEPLQIHPALRLVIRDQFDLLPICREDYKEVILKPAERATSAGRKLLVDHDLVKVLRDEAEGADALPLIAYTLERLFIEHGSDGDLRLDEYRKFGGVKGAIDQAVASALGNPGHDPCIPNHEDEQYQYLRAAFIPWLARIDPETEIRKRRVARLRDIPANSHTLIMRFINARLLTSNSVVIDGTKEAVVEIAHEALLRQWTMLDGWLRDDAIKLKTLEIVRQSSGEWIKNQRGKDWLLRGERLATAEELLLRQDFAMLVGKEGTSYLAFCRKTADQEHADLEKQLNKTAQMQKRIGRLFAIVAMVLSIGLLTALEQIREIGHQTSLVLATAAQAASDAGYFDRALRYAVLATKDTLLSPASIEAEPQLARAAHASAMLAQLPHESVVTFSAINSDGTKIVTASGDKTARVWDLARGKELIKFTLESEVETAAFNPDSTKVVSISKDFSVRVWDTTSGKELVQFMHKFRLSVPGFKTARFSPDGTKIVTTAPNGPVRIWDSVSGKELGQLDNKGIVQSAVFSPDGTKIVTASGNRFIPPRKPGAAHIWDVASGKELFHLQHDHQVISASFSLDGTKIVTAAVDDTVKIWDAVNGKEQAQFTDISSIQSCEFTREGIRVITASEDFKTARIWDPVGKEELFRMALDGPIGSALFNSDGTKLITTSYVNSAQVWDLTSSQEDVQLSDNTSIESGALSPDRTKIVIGSKDKIARVWDLANNKEFAQFTLEDVLKFVVFSPDGTKIVTSSRDKIARVWDLVSNKELPPITNETGFETLGFSSDSTRVIVPGVNNTARVLNLNSGEEVARLTFESEIGLSSFNYDRTELYIEKTGQVLDINSGKELGRLPHLDGLEFAIFSYDGTKIGTVSHGDIAQIWDVASGKEFARFPHAWHSRALTFSPDSKKAFTYLNATVSVWELATKRELVRLPNIYDVEHISFSPDGTKVITSAESTQIWDLTTGKEIARIGHNKSFGNPIFSPDGTKVLAFSANMTAKVWSVQWLTQYHGQDLRKKVCREKLIGARHLVSRDIEISPLLSGHEGEDVCDPPSWFYRFIGILGNA